MVAPAMPGLWGFPPRQVAQMKIIILIYNDHQVRLTAFRRNLGSAGACGQINWGLMDHRPTSASSHSGSHYLVKSNATANATVLQVLYLQHEEMYNGFCQPPYSDQVGTC
jgi:hypothetical protein